ncbi:hypothetical protein HanIR_Chr14g0727671 [Helianthus annuus]|nr:hypothetical protein HanIR_Chr14g0727671 [Helianthus annuus]
MASSQGGKSLCNCAAITSYSAGSPLTSWIMRRLLDTGWSTSASWAASSRSF